MRTWEFSYLFRAGCVLCCVPTEVSKCPDELADFKGDCSAALQPSSGGGCVLFASPSYGLGSPRPWPFQLLLALRSLQACPSNSSVKWQG